MPKFLFYGAYTPEGLKGVLAEGDSSRVEAVHQGTRFIIWIYCNLTGSTCHKEVQND